MKLGKIKFQHDKIEEFFFKQYIEESEYKGISFFHSVFDLCERNVIYQNGVLQYFLELEKSKRLKELKDLINNMFVEHIDMLSKILVQLLSCSRDLNDTLFYLVNPDDTEESRKIISAIMWGIDQNLQDYSSSTYSIKRIIDGLQTEPINRVIPKDMQIYIYFFKSKLEYFLGDYINALNYVKKAQKVSKCHDSILSTQIDIHYAVILTEQGYSKKCINCLEEDYKVHQDSNNIKIKIDVGIELGRALNHSGQIARTLKLYDDLLIHENEIADSYVLARIYEQKANVLNKLMFHKLQYGFVKKETLSPNTIIEIKKLFKDALLLYNKAIKLLLETNAIFTYSGVLPEKINTYISYSISIEPQGIDECKNMITELDSIFNIISTPFETDFDLSKAYYYEYMKNTDIAESYIKEALNKAIKMQIKNKEAKCRCFYSQFCYRQLKKNTNNAKKWLTIGTKQLEMAIKYYEEYTLIDHNISLENCYLLSENFSQINA